MFGNVFGENGLPQSDEYWMRRFAFVAKIKFTLPPIEELESPHGIRDFVTKIVGPPAVRVDVVEMLVKGFREKPGDYVEVLVMMCGEPVCVLLGCFRRAARVRSVEGNVEFAGKKH